MWNLFISHSPENKSPVSYEKVRGRRSCLAIGGRREAGEGASSLLSVSLRLQPCASSQTPVITCVSCSSLHRPLNCRRLHSAGTSVPKYTALSHLPSSTIISSPVRCFLMGKFLHFFFLFYCHFMGVSEKRGGKCVYSFCHT